MGVATFKIKIGGDASGVKAAANTAITQFKRIERSAISVGNFFRGAANRFGLGGILSGVGAGLGTAEIIRHGAAISDLSKSTGISTKRLQELGYAAEQNGGNMDLITKAVQKLGEKGTEALAGNRGLVSIFERLGVSLDDLAKKRPEEIFMLIADALKGTKTSAAQTHDVIKIFGDEMLKLLPALKSNFADTVQEAERLGIAINEIDLATLKQAQQDLDKAKRLALPHAASAVAMGAEAIDVMGSLAMKSQPASQYLAWPVALIAQILGKRSVEKNLPKFELNRDAQGNVVRVPGSPASTEEEVRNSAAEAARLDRIAAARKKLQDKLDAFTFAQLSNAEKKQELLEKQNKIQRAIDAENDEEKRLQLEMEKLDVAKDLKALEAKKFHPPEMSEFELDDLAKQGLFIGPQLQHRLNLTPRADEPEVPAHIRNRHHRIARVISTTGKDGKEVIAPLAPNTPPPTQNNEVFLLKEQVAKLETITNELRRLNRNVEREDIYRLRFSGMLALVQKALPHLGRIGGAASDHGHRFYLCSTSCMAMLARTACGRSRARGQAEKSSQVSR